MPATFDGLSYLESLPFAFRPIAVPPDTAESARMNAEGVQVLMADASLEDIHRGPDPKDDDGPSAADLQRIEFKLNVLLQLVAGLLARSGDQPPPVPVRLFGDGLEYQATGPVPATGAAGIAHVYISRGFPKALELPGKVVGSRQADGVTWVRVEFVGVGPQVTDLLERLIFRHHRRQVAEARGHAR